MAKILVTLGPSEQPQQIELEGFYVPGTDNTFAVNANDLGEGDLFNLTHIPTGWACAKDVTKLEAVWVARQLFAVCPEAWELDDMDAIREAVPHWVKQWIVDVMHAIQAAVPVCLLKSCPEYCREMNTLEKNAKGNCAGS
jgi:hypothetical protein